MSRKNVAPAWWKNTYFWIAGILMIIALFGVVRGAPAIRDPGQKREDGLVLLLYFAGAITMFVNGWLSHRQTVQLYEESLDSVGKEN